MNTVSVIIPVYNVEQYLPKCLDSVIGQTYRELEIICVNDCSPDNSAEILQQYALKDVRIKIINREKNGGLSAARNTGMSAATGEYIYFIDSDDWIDEDYLEKMVNAIEKVNTDIVLNTNIIRAEENTAIPFEWKRYSKQFPEGEYLSTETAINCSQVMIWAHLYKKSFLDEYNLRFPEGYIQEDEYFQHISKIRCDKIFCFSGSAYYYRQRAQSIMGSRKSKVIPVAGIFDLLIDFYSKNRFFLLQYAIKFSLINVYSQIAADDEFNIAKKTVQHYFCSNLYFYFTDFEYFLLMLINESSSFEEFRQKIGKNIRIAYMRKALISKPKVSVIIPVYNVEPYLRKCLNSVCNQTLRDIEIICVNDCSPDNSLAIIKEYAQNDTRIKLIDFKENKGVAIARNTAMKKARGEYIGFVDPDDWIDLDFYEKLYNKSKEYDSDLVIGNVVEENENGKKNFMLFDLVLSKIQENKLNFNQLFWLGVYRKSLLDDHNITFIDHCIYGEDRLLPLMGSFYAKNFQYDLTAYYHYFRNSSSVTKKRKNEKILSSFILSNEKIFDFLTSQSMTKEDYLTVASTFWDNMLIFPLNLDGDFYIEYLKNLYSRIIPKIRYDIIEELPLSKDLLVLLSHGDYKACLTKIKPYSNQKTLVMLRKRVAKND